MPKFIIEDDYDKFLGIVEAEDEEDAFDVACTKYIDYVDEDGFRICEMDDGEASVEGIEEYLTVNSIFNRALTITEYFIRNLKDIGLKVNELESDYDKIKKLILNFEKNAEKIMKIGGE